MNKYKIGDRVRVINGIGKLQDAMRGRIGTVAVVHEIDGVQHCWVLIDGFDNPHKVDPTIAFHYNQLAPWLNDSKDAKELALSRYLGYKKNNEYKKEVAKYCRNDVAATTALFNAVQNLTYIPKIKDVIYSDPATIVFWKDGTKTVVKCKNEKFDPERAWLWLFQKRCSETRATIIMFSRNGFLMRNQILPFQFAMKFKICVQSMLIKLVRLNLNVLHALMV